MSRFDRVKQWSTFARTWHLYDAKWQNPFHSAKIITNHLEGKNKPIYHPKNDCGDHVVVINSKHIALLGREWQYRVYFHHTGYPKAHKHSGVTNGALWIPAWQLHDRDPTLILWKACYNNLEGNLTRPKNMARLHIFPEDKVPEDLLENITSQLEPLRPVPATLADYSPEQRDKFPKVFDYPEKFVSRSQIE
ncbi:39S ribosomal protein L13, mitochondrial [Eurytemora carolleeae]|uniref:39S ribosomal protein L13, mitochondrial n=1 Tax=Eurytemora carolleeae TaxID=1294199 RepID=UPI000C75818D|nr:39S ribosomal protein L13, mitochondrial [Eurytemora carolleeae]|eukprot:XP_023331570.1 39S ribosomal protein L13, mitochondrial-like [Eurytemora affinis]